MKEKYQELKKKFSILPEYEEINAEFDIENLEKINITTIRKKIGERIEFCLETLERIINPEPDSLIDLCECRTITEKEKITTFEIFKKMMEIYRELLEADININKELQAKTIRKICLEFPEQRKKIIPLIKKLKESWKEHIEHKEIIRYMG